VKEDRISKAVLRHLGEAARLKGINMHDVGMDQDILSSGLVDSFGFLSLIEELEEELGVAINLADMDGRCVTTPAGLTQWLQDTASAHGE